MDAKIVVEIRPENKVRAWGVYSDHEFNQNMRQLYGFVYNRWNPYSAKDVWGGLENCPAELAEILSEKQAAVQFGRGESIRFVPMDEAPSEMHAAKAVLREALQACYILDVDEARSIAAGEHDNENTFGDLATVVKEKIVGVLKRKF